MRKALLLFIFIGITAVAHGDYQDNASAYVIYLDANDYYTDGDLVSAKSTYIELITTYPSSFYVPYALYMLSYLETDYLKIIDYLTIIEETYPDFPYWTDAMERLGDIYYIIGVNAAAIEKYTMANTETSLYMIAMLYSADGYQEQAIEIVDTLLRTTSDYSLAYRAYLIQAKAYIDMYEYNSALAVLIKTTDYIDWSFDNGARLLYYTGKSLFYSQEYAKSLYAFSILRTRYPYAAESALAKNYLTYLENNNIIVSEQVYWLEGYFEERAELPFLSENASLTLSLEDAAESLVEEAEAINGQIVFSELQEYVVRVGEFQDLGVANLVAVDLAGSEYNFPIGIYFRDGLYYAEIRGLDDLDEATDYATQMISIGYTDTRVIEVVKITEYGKDE